MTGQGPRAYIYKGSATCEMYVGGRHHPSLRGAHSLPWEATMEPYRVCPQEGVTNGLREAALNLGLGGKDV